MLNIICKCAVDATSLEVIDAMDETPPPRKRLRPSVESLVLLREVVRTRARLPEPRGLPVVLSPTGCADTAAAPEDVPEAVQDEEGLAALTDHTEPLGDADDAEAAYLIWRARPSTGDLHGECFSTSRTSSSGITVGAGVAAVGLSSIGPASSKPGTPMVGAIMSIRGPGGRASKSRVEIMDVFTLTCQVRMLASGEVCEVAHEGLAGVRKG